MARNPSNMHISREKLSFEAPNGAPTEKSVFLFTGGPPRRNSLFRKNPRMKLTFPSQNSNKNRLFGTKFERGAHFSCQNAYFSRITTHGKCRNAYFSRNIACGASCFEAKCVFLEKYSTWKMQKCVFLEKYVLENYETREMPKSVFLEKNNTFSESLYYTM